jgi:hypothetical protein
MASTFRELCYLGAIYHCITTANLMAQTVRVLYSIRPEILGRFNSVFKGWQRSRAIEQLMERAIAEREAEVVSAARRIDTDPDFADVRAISDEVDSLSAETAAKHLS